MRAHLFGSLFLLPLVVATAAPASAIVVTPGRESQFVVGPTISLPDVNAADAVVAGAAIFVGQGGFGAGLQSILRRDPDGTTTTVVDGLNALGGLAYDVAGDRLLFTDNGGDLLGATSGDTVYALPSPHTVGAPVDAATLTLLPSGSIPFAQAVLPLPGGDVLIGDAAGPGSGRVVKLSGGVPTDFITGLDYVAGISINFPGIPDYFPEHQIQVGNVDGSFVGSVERYTVAGAPLGTVNMSPLSGALDQATDVAGNVYVTGGFTGGFTSSTLVFVAQGGAVDEVASGFGFSSGVTVDVPSQRILVLDFGQPFIDTLLRVDWLTAGGNGKSECQIETWGTLQDVSGSGNPLTKWTCADGDPACDRDLAVNGGCAFQVGTCVRLSDLARNPKCTPVDIDTVTITSKKLPAAASTLQTAANALLPATEAKCGEGNLVAVPADRKTRTIRFEAAAAGKRVDRDVLKLRCLP
jgi:hypothetical protein